MGKNITGVVLAVGLAGLGLAAAGCSKDDTDTSAPTTTAPSAVTTRPASEPAGSPTGDCPAAADLHAVVKASEIATKLPASYSGVEKVSCAQGYATARTIVTNADPATVVFALRSGVWTVLTFGTGDVCTGTVPAATAPKLTGCTGAY